MNIKIGDKTYIIEFTFEAVRHKETVEELATFFASISDMQEKIENKDVKSLSSAISGKSDLVLSLFHAGLLENHGCHKYGDGTVPDMETATDLLRQYFKENKGDKKATWNGIYEELGKQMQEDDFLAQVGLGGMTEEEMKEVKKPQDHKPKQVNHKPLTK